MPSQLAIASNKPRRRPKSGSGFALLRLTGWLLKAIGLLLAGLALLGFIVILVRAGPTLAEALQYPEQRMAGFIVLIVLGYLSVPLVLGLGGAALAGVGFALSYWGTKPAVSSPDTELSPTPTARGHERDKDAG